MKTERKQSSGCIVKASRDGTITAIVATLGNVSAGAMGAPEIYAVGAFGESVRKRGPMGANQIRVLWQYDFSAVIGRPVTLQEVGLSALPAVVRKNCPDAQGGLYAVIRLNLDVQRGREAMALYRDRAMSCWALTTHVIDETTTVLGGQRVRVVKKAELYAINAVTFCDRNSYTVEVEKARIANRLSITQLEIKRLRKKARSK